MSDKDIDNSAVSFTNGATEESIKNSHGVTIHTSPDKLGEFILNLLSKPQKMKKLFLGSYKVYLSNLLDIHHKIHQCVGLDRQGLLVEFSAEVVFEDKSSIVVNSIDEFSTYRFPDNSIPLNCILNWVYVVQFKNNTTPEKQSIEIIIKSGEGHVFSSMEGRNNLNYQQDGSIEITIECTNRVLGRTVETEISSIIDTIVEPISKIKQTMMNYHSAIYHILSIILTFIGLWIGYNYSINAILDTNTTLNYVYHNIVNYITFLVFIIIISKGLTTWILDSYGAGWRFYTFLMLNDASEKYYKKVKNRKIFFSISFFTSLVATILTGLIANYVFKYLTSS